jgi:YVTN family beta-propeller protein
METLRIVLRNPAAWVLMATTWQAEFDADHAQVHRHEHGHGQLRRRAGPGPVAITPDGKTGYIGNDLDITVSVFDTDTDSVTKSIPVGAEPSAMAITPNGASSTSPTSRPAPST